MGWPIVSDNFLLKCPVVRDETEMQQKVIDHALKQPRKQTYVVEWCHTLSWSIQYLGPKNSFCVETHSFGVEKNGSVQTILAHSTNITVMEVYYYYYFFFFGPTKWLSTCLFTLVALKLVVLILC